METHDFIEVTAKLSRFHAEAFRGEFGFTSIQDMYAHAEALIQEVILAGKYGQEFVESGVELANAACDRYRLNYQKLNETCVEN